MTICVVDFITINRIIQSKTYMNYKQIYNSLIIKAVNRIIDPSEYFEAHHIMPKCIGGTNISENLVKLYPEEHLVAHLLLAKIYDSPKMIYAANMMVNRIKNNKHYGWVKRKFARAEAISKTGKKRTVQSIEKQKETIRKKYEAGYISPATGNVLSESHKIAISNANKNKVVNTKSRSSLEGYISRYGEEVGMEKYKIDSAKKDSSSLKFFIKRYGCTEGHIKYNNKVNKLSELAQGTNGSFYGKFHTDKTKRAIASNTALCQKGKKKSEDHKIKIGLANKGRIHKTMICPFCYKSGSISNMKRWHFNNCKLAIV